MPESASAVGPWEAVTWGETPIVMNGEPLMARQMRMGDVTFQEMAVGAYLFDRDGQEIGSA